MNLNCGLCHSLLNNPKTLDCLHSFCSQCLQEFLGNFRGVEGALKCPVCEDSFELPLGGIEALHPDIFLLKQLGNSSVESPKKKEKFMCQDEENEAEFFCLDCNDNFCESCLKVHQKMKLFTHHKIISMEERRKTNLVVNSNMTCCLVHPQKEVDLYCCDCEEAMCSVCIDSHKSHNISTLSNAFGNEREEILELIHQVQTLPHSLEVEIQHVEDAIESLDRNLNVTQKKISQNFSNIHQNLIEREEQLQQALTLTYNSKKDSLNSQKKNINFGIQTINESCSLIKRTIEEGTEKEILIAKKRYLARLHALQLKNWKFYSDQIIMDFSFLKENERLIKSSIQEFGSIVVNDISAENCKIRRRKKSKIQVYDSYSFDIISYSKNNVRVEQGENKFIVYIGGPSDVQETIIDNENGIYTVSFVLPEIGRYVVNVFYKGKQIQCPFEISVISRVEQSRNYGDITQPKIKFGQYGNSDAKFSNPNFVCVDPIGNIFVSDRNNHRIQIFDENGNFLSKFGTNGEGNGQFQYPCGIAIDYNETIYVCDTENHRVQVFDRDKNFIMKFGKYGKEDGQFQSPYSIVVSSTGNLIVADTFNHRIQIFSQQGIFISKFGSLGSLEGQFHHPYSIAINSMQNIIICDFHSHRIQIFDENGNFLLVFGSKGNANGQFMNPCHIAIDEYDQLLVVDNSNNRIQIFDSFGTFITQFGSNCLNYPTGIAIDTTTQTIIVTEAGPNRVSIF